MGGERMQDLGAVDIGVWTECAGHVNLPAAEVKGEPCPSCGEPRTMMLRIDLGLRGNERAEPFDRYICELCCPPILHPPATGFSLGPRP